MSPITRASGKKSVVLARYARNRRLGDALYGQAFTALNASPGRRSITPPAGNAEPRTIKPCAPLETGWSASCTAA